MTDAQFKEQKRRVRKYLDKWQKPCGFGWWDVHVEFSREREEEQSNTIGQCWANWQYRHATIRFYLPVIMEESDADVEKAVLHELCHLLVSPLEDFSTPEKRKITEYTTSLVTDALFWAHTQVKGGND